MLNFLAEITSFVILRFFVVRYFRARMGSKAAPSYIICLFEFIRV